MTEAGKEEVTSIPSCESDYTKVSFIPDLPKLTGDPNASILSSDDYAHLCRRVVDIAGCKGEKVIVTLNQSVIPVKGFEQYSKLYFRDRPICFRKINSRWGVGIALSPTGSFESISFVNGMATTRGGTHVNSILQQVTKKISDRVEKMHPDLVISPALVRRHLFLFCNALIENPSFDSQMKETLTSNPSTFGSQCHLSEKFLNEIMEEGENGPGILEEVVRVARGQLHANLLKTIGAGKKNKRQVLSVEKLDDAHLAGTKAGKECTLVLTEGDSAKALAVAGLEVVGREHYGVFPLRGKFLNVRDASVSKLASNAEVKNLCIILGLDFDKQYDTKKERDGLRYGKVMLMTDQDADGSHIKGLVINFLYHFWPALLKPSRDDPEESPFLSSFITPLLKAVTKKGKKETKSFFSVTEYNAWRSSLPENKISGWDVKYYKGLGTSTSLEAREYFKDFSKHHRPFRWDSDEDGMRLDMLFDKSRASDRREWILQQHEEDATVVEDESAGNAVTYQNFVDKEMIHFSNADNVRSIPHVIDGLKPSQRKVLFSCFKRNLKREIKVAQLAGYCAEHTAYHHGEASLHSTIVSMAQDFVGSNNLNLLVPSGQFGTRLVGGKDAASPRYIFTRLSPVARVLFPEIDDSLLTHKEEDGQEIEPEFFCPVIPLVLVNGGQGIGTGWSTSIFPHNPHDVVDYIRAKLDCTELPCIRPWVQDFTGEICPKEDGSGLITKGRIEQVSPTSVRITELPVGRWTNDYKNHLLKMRGNGTIQSFVEDHTTTSVSFTVTLRAAQLNRISGNLHKAFRLETSTSSTNMNLFDQEHSINKYTSAEAIADAYFPVRLGLYYERKKALESNLEYEATLLSNKARFINEVADGRIDIVQQRMSKAAIHKILEKDGFMKSSDMDAIKYSANASLSNEINKEKNDQVNSEEEINGDEKDFSYLLNMSLSSFTSERTAALEAEALKKRQDLESIRCTTPEDLWRADLDKLEDFLLRKRA